MRSIPNVNLQYEASECAYGHILPGLAYRERLNGLFEESALIHAENVAVEAGTRRLTYRELDLKANQLAWHLRTLGVAAGSRVGILLERSLEAYIAILGVLKAGAAFVPLDTAFPVDRIEFIAADAGLSRVVTVGALASRLGSASALALPVDLEAEAIARAPLDRIPDPGPGSSDDELCYIIYTSGSTGRPKGVAIEHRSICNFVKVVKGTYGVRRTDRVYQGLSIAFDFSVEEIWPAWLSGATLVAGPTGACRLGPDLGRFLTENSITVMCCVPTLLATIDEDVPSLRLLNIGGEACPPELVTRWGRAGRRILNTYGPTEATVTATWTELAPGRKITIGKPLPTYRVFIADRNMKPAPVGEAGEIMIGGVGVARGYINREELNRKVFVRDPDRDPNDPASRLYRTGDLGRMTPEGEIEFLGRMDTQVKIRGYRIELSEIESVIRNDPSVKQVVVTTCGQSGQIQDLVAYIVPRNGRSDAAWTAEISEGVRQSLPPYMVPRFMEVIKELPLLASGKVDRSKLPRPDFRRPASNRAHIEPSSPDESAIASIWASVFASGKISVQDDFFTDLGGNSLYAARAVSALRKDPAFAHLSVIDIYNYPTVRALADRAAALGPELKEAAAPAGMKTKPEKRRFLLCGAIQGSLIYLLVAASVLPLMPVFLWAMNRGVPTGGALGVMECVLMAAAVMTLFGFVAPIAGKWLLLGRVKPGVHPLWGSFYVRWWLARKLMMLAPLGILSGSPLLASYARLLGAKIGSGCYLGTIQMSFFDMLEIGDGSSIGYNTQITGFKLERGMLRVGPIKMGRDCFVGNNSVVQPDTVIGESGKLGDQSLLPAGAAIPAGESWSGSPAQADAVSDPAKAWLHDLSPASVKPRRAAFLLGALVQILVPILAMTPGVLFLWRLTLSGSGWWFLAGALPASLMFVIALCLLIAAGKTLLVPSVRPGTYRLDSSLYLRKWLADKLVESSLALVNSLYATLYLPPFLRLLGARIGKRVEVSTASNITPDLLTIRDESFVADMAFVGTGHIYRGHMQLGATTIGYRSFVGNAALLPAGRDLPDNTLLGVMSVPPCGEMPEGSNWVGSPAVYLPRRQESESFSVEQTFQPTTALYMRRLTYEFFRVTLPGALMFVLGGVTLKLCAMFARADSILLLAAVFPLIYYGAALGLNLFPLLLKKLLIGVYKPLQRPLWNNFVWRTELITGVYENFTVPTLLGFFTGTPFAAMVLRRFGAKIGKRVFMDTTYLTEFDLVRVGDDAVIGQNSSLQTHLFEDRVMKMSYVTVGAGCSVGIRAIVLYDSVMSAGAGLDDLSLLMKGESLLPGTSWRGAPARRCG